jgi:hypothetical protein
MSANRKSVFCLNTNYGLNSYQIPYNECRDNDTDDSVNDAFGHHPDIDRRDQYF